MIVETKRHANAWTSGKTVRGHKGVGMEGFIASWYARQTAKDMDRFKSLARRLAPQIGRDSRVLEIAPGPGYLAIELARLTRCRMIGVDISRTFVRIASENAEKAGVDIAFDEGDAADLDCLRVCLISSSAAQRSRISRGRSRRWTKYTAC